MNDEEKYWEQEYLGFEKTFPIGTVFWRTPAHRLRGTMLYSVFEQFCMKFPDHPNDHNTVLYLFDHVHVSPRFYSVLLWCSHFEHNSLDDLRVLVDFLDFARGLIVSEGYVFLESLDIGEQVRIRFYEPVNDVVADLQKRQTRKCPEC